MNSKNGELYNSDFYYFQCFEKTLLILLSYVQLIAQKLQIICINIIVSFLKYTSLINKQQFHTVKYIFLMKLTREWLAKI